MYREPNPWRFDNTTKDLSRSEILLDLIKHGNYSKCLDIGCGEGAFTNRILNYVDWVDAFDVSERAIKRANENFGKANINFYVEDARCFKALKTYDLIICLEMLYYLDEQERRKLLFEIRNSMNPGGVFILTVVVNGRNKYRDYFSLESIMSLLKEHFRIVHVFPVIPKSRILFGLTKIVPPIRLRRNLYRLFSLLTNPSNAYQSGFVLIRMN